MNPKNRPILNYRPPQRANPKGRLLLSIFFMIVGLVVLTLAFLLLYFSATGLISMMLPPNAHRAAIVLLCSLAFLVGLAAVVFAFKGLAHCCVLAGNALDDLNIASPNPRSPEKQRGKDPQPGRISQKL